MGESNGQVRIVRAVDDEDERVSRVPSSRNRSLPIRSVHNSLHDEAQARLAGHSEVDVQDPDGPKPKVMETVCENGEIHQGLERLGNFHGCGCCLFPMDEASETRAAQNSKTTLGF